MPNVSVVIPTKNGERTLPAVLKRIFGQQGVERPEVIMVDSGSSDQTLTIAKRYPVSIIEIPAQEFNHGETRNLGIRKAKGEYIVLLTQDAEPTDERWLKNLIRNFSDPTVAGVYCRQIPRDEADVITKRRLNAWLTGGTARYKNKIEDRARYEELAPREKHRFCNFDNVCSLIRKKVWEEIPFEKTYFAEDLAWGKKVLEAGYTIVYEPEAAVYHSHPWHTYRRHYICHRRLYQLFGFQTVPSFRDAVLCTVKDIFFESRFVWREEPVFFRKLSLVTRLPLLALLSVFGQYLGAKYEKQRILREQGPGARDQSDMRTSGF